MKKLKTVLITLLCVFCVLFGSFCFGKIAETFRWRGPMVDATVALLPESNKYDLRFFHIKEHDRYGRLSFYGEAPVSGLSDFVIIIQATDRKADSIYYYPDQGLFLIQHIENLTDAEYERFKELNDWGKPLNYEKMICFESD